MLTNSLEDNLRKRLAPPQSHTNVVLAFGKTELERTLGADGCVTRPTAAKQREEEEDWELQLTSIVAFAENT